MKTPAAAHHYSCTSAPGQVGTCMQSQASRRTLLSPRMMTSFGPFWEQFGSFIDFSPKFENPSNGTNGNEIPTLSLRKRGGTQSGRGMDYEARPDSQLTEDHISNYNFRNKKDYYQKYVTTKQKQMCLSVFGIKLWNSLDSKIRQSETIYSFKSKYKYYLLNNQGCTNLFSLR